MATIHENSRVSGLSAEPIDKRPSPSLPSVEQALTVIRPPNESRLLSDIQGKLALLEEGKKGQRSTLDSLRVGTIDAVLPPSLLPLVHSGYSTGRSPVHFPDGTQLDIHTAENGIATVKKLKRKKNIFLFTPVYEILDYYLVDKKTEKAWDVGQLWKDKSSSESLSKPIQTISIPSMFNAAAVRTIEGEYLILNSLSNHPNAKMLNEKAGKDIVKIIDDIVPLHEAGHTFQMQDDKKSKDDLGWTLFKSWLIRKLVFPALPFIIKTGIKSEGIQTFLKMKQLLVGRERNAHAFALATIRKLRDQGIDILRDTPTLDVRDSIELALSSYDKAVPIPGEAFSQENRRTRRKKLLKRI